MSEKIEAVITCVGRSSFLKETIPLNLPKVDNIIVVTTPTDYETHRVCRDHGVEYIKTNIFYENESPFDKGKAINEGVDMLIHNKWVIFMDADILLVPPHIQFFKNLDKLDKENLYGCRRIVLRTREEFESFTKKVAFNPSLVNLGEMINDDPQEIGVGFFQMFNIQSDRVKEIIDKELILDDVTFDQLVLPLVNDPNYPRRLKESGKLHPYFPTAGGSDSQFRHLFVEKEAFVACDIPVIHLGNIGKGHGGRAINFI